MVSRRDIFPELVTVTFIGIRSLHSSRLTNDRMPPYLILLITICWFISDFTRQSRRSWRRRLRTRTTLRGKNLWPVSVASHWWWFSTETGHRVLPLSAVLVRCPRLQDLLVLQSTAKSTRKTSQEFTRQWLTHKSEVKCGEDSSQFRFFEIFRSHSF